MGKWTRTGSTLDKLHLLPLLPGMFLPHRLTYSPFSSLCLLITIEMKSVLPYIKLTFPQSLSTNIPYSLFTLLFFFFSRHFLFLTHYIIYLFIVRMLKYPYFLCYTRKFPKQDTLNHWGMHNT